MGKPSKREGVETISHSGPILNRRMAPYRSGIKIGRAVALQVGSLLDFAQHPSAEIRDKKLRRKMCIILS